MNARRRLRRSAPRIVGGALLVLMLGVQAAHWGAGELSWRDSWWDMLHQAMPRDRGDPDAAPAVVIAIDEETMLHTQRWPWPRDLIADLLDALARHGVRVVAFDIFLDNRDPQSPTALAQRYRARGLPNVAATLGRLEDSDVTLARAIHDNREAGVATILPVPGVPDYEGVNAAVECRFDKPIVTTDPADLLDGLGEGFASADAPLRVHREAGAQLAAVDFEASSDFVLRRLRAVQRICGAPFLLLGAEALRLANEGFYTVIRESRSGMEVWLDDPSNPEALHFPIERDGSFWLHFGELGVRTADGGRELRRYISAKDVLSDGFDSARLDGRIALVAVIDLGRIYERRSPLGPIIYGVEAHMQMIEQIVAGDFLRRPWFLPMAEGLALALAGILVIVLVPALRPARSIVVIVAAGAVMLAASG